MVQTLQAKNVTLSELSDRFALELTDDEQFFREWQVDLPEVTAAEKQRLDRVKSSFSNLLEYPSLLENTVKMVVLSPLLDLADVYQKPFHIKSEPSFQITTEDEGTVIRGDVDVLVLRDRLWVMVIEAKRAAVDVDEGRAQLLSYMLASPTIEKPAFGMITNGRNFLFVKLIQQPTPRYALSRLFSLVNPGNELYTVLGVLKRLVALVQQGDLNGTA
ncbi:type I restriction enzyme HsdR N-terminal domain-containing protein [Leptolyngbya sp. FACHB-17]|uniref:type I restriction enzyme HsdR N-terminal domain-containing protein n=1 Tax=unclassified Leptolyngbya TaxID=2650499 RepID=UPI0016817202|nr:type I restriction enzyme HsdR N-terminal domain-containing protein [Leptolyngbya sp. FACHB-17]MBD2078377.1 type I restriction enzyme HsdR N-terminal domain-containing protein [Leptolyngbya sp. FACHB-17]